MVEYSIVLGIITLVLIAMNPLIKRSIQGVIKVAADQIGVQNNSDQIFNDAQIGHMVSSYTTTRTAMVQDRSESIGALNYIYGDNVFTSSTTILNLGHVNVTPP